MKKSNYIPVKSIVYSIAILLALSVSHLARAQVSLLSEVKVTDEALYFDGTKNTTSTNKDVNAPYDYAYGRPINPHGDCIKTYKEYVFMSWYRGGKENRHVMLSRLNTLTGSIKTIEFPHQHTGYNGNWWIGETHNTIAIGICPRNGTIHLAYDMHAYGNAGPYVNDYFRYSYSVSNTANMADDDFTLDKFIKDPLDGDYKHCTMNGVRNPGNFSRLSYPEFFTNNDGELFLCMRTGTSHDGAMVYIKYNDNASKWGSFKNITALGAKSKGETHDWSIYGKVKFTGGKMRMGFQRRLRDGSDKFVYQNGVYYAYSDDPTGASKWKNYKGEAMTFPLVKAGEVLIMEPGDYVETTAKNMVHIVDGFDFEVTDRGDEHIISKVTDKQNGVKKLLHTYRKSGDSDFTTVEYNAGSELYASGNDIYVIGLIDGRVNIVKTEGGTSDFKEIYQHTSGATFDKGIVHISDGKLYYYLKKTGGSGAKRTTYLQVFDLGIPRPELSRTLEFKNIANNQEIVEGANLSIEANVGEAFQEVALWSGTTNLGTQTEAPYTWTGHDVLSNMAEPIYSFKLIAKDAQGVTTEQSLTLALKLKVKPDANSLISKLLFYYPVEQNGQDISENDNNATLGAAVAFEAGKYGRGAVFGQTEGSYLSTEDAVFKYNNPTAYTIAFWLKVSDFSMQANILQPIGGRSLLYSNGDLSFSTDHQKQVADFSINETEKDEWFHVAMLIDQREGQTQHQFYINGEPRGVVAEGYELETAVPQSFGSLIFGSVSNAELAKNFTGMLDEICMFDDILSPEDIKFIMNAENLKVHLRETVGIDKTNSTHSLKIYPVPTNQNLYIEGADGVRAVVYDISGKIIKTENVYNNQLNVASLKNGIYILEIEDCNKKRHQFRFVKH